MSLIGSCKENNLAQHCEPQALPYLVKVKGCYMCLIGSCKENNPCTVLYFLNTCTSFCFERAHLLFTSFTTWLLVFCLRETNEGVLRQVHVAGAGGFSLAGVTDSYDLFPVGSFGNFDRLVEQSTGTYLRLDVLDVPPEIVEKFDPHHPILVGVILPEEENFGYMQVKLKRHSWRMDLLMTGAPITISAGWRRYHTTAIYAMENKNGQHELLNYTPEHKECLAVFWGPLAPPKTRIVAVMNNLNCLKNKEPFQIVAKGVVIDFNLDAQILLKVERIGTLVDTGGKTARIKFAPKLKIDGFKFIGASIHTKSGVRGKIDKVARDGLVECTFKDNVNGRQAII